MPNRFLIPTLIADTAVKHHTREVISFSVCVLSVISASQEQALWWAQFLSYVVAALAGAFTIWGIWRKRRGK